MKARSRSGSFMMISPGISVPSGMMTLNSLRVATASTLMLLDPLRSSRPLNLRAGSIWLNEVTTSPEGSMRVPSASTLISCSGTLIDSRPPSALKAILATAESHTTLSCFSVKTCRAAAARGSSASRRGDPAQATRQTMAAHSPGFRFINLIGFMAFTTGVPVRDTACGCRA